MAYCTSTDIEYMLEYEDLVLLTNDRDVNATSTLSQGIDSTSTNIYLTNSDEFPTSGRIEVDNEQIDYSYNIYNQLGGLTRAVNNTVEADHNSGSTVDEIHKINSTVISRAISDADAEIDSYLGTVFSDVPLSEIPNVIRKTSVDITVYNLYSRRLSIPEQIESRYQNAIKFLERVLEGKISLGDPSVEALKEDNILTNMYESDKKFSIGSDYLGSIGTLDDY